MGAGSAKGIQEAPEEDADAEVDRFSVVSEDSPERTSKIQKPIIEPPKDKILPILSKPKGPTTLIADLEDDEEDIVVDGGNELSKSLPKPVAPVVLSEADADKKEEKKRGLFGFSKWKEESVEDKTSAFVHEEEKEKAKKESTTSKGFKLFNWKKESKGAPEKDEHLDKEINELQKTFDSLGIVGKSIFDDDKKKGNAKSNNKSQSADDIRNLEPMRNKMNAKSKAARSNGIHKGSEVVATTSGGSRRTFKYSWETENTASAPPREDDRWSYKAVVIDGFDLEKFKRANHEDTLIGSRMMTRIPNSIDDDSPMPSPRGVRSPPTYDPMEQKLLATIEREFAL